MKISTPAVHNLKDKNMKFDICKKIICVRSSLEKSLQQTFQTSVYSLQSIRIMEGTLQWTKYEAPPSPKIFLFFVFVYYCHHYQYSCEGFLLWGWSDLGVGQLLPLSAFTSSNQDIPPRQLPRSASTNGRGAVCEDQVWRFVV